MDLMQDSGLLSRDTPEQAGARRSPWICSWDTGDIFFCTYCGWRKSCTTLDGWNPISKGINHLSTGAGLFPSTVCMDQTFWLWLTVCHGKSPFLIGKPSINGPSIPWLFNVTRGYAFIHSFEIDLWIQEFIDHWFLTKPWSTAWLAHFEARKKGSPILKWLALSKIFWLVVWNIFILPYIRNNHPNWLIFFRGIGSTWLNHQAVFNSSPRMLIPLDFHIMATQPSQLSKLTRKACWIVRDLRGNAPISAVEGGSMVGPGGVKHVLPGWSRLSYLYLSIHPSIHPSIHLTIYPSIHPSIYLCVCRAITGLRWSWWHSIVSLANCFTQVLLLSLYMSISISFIYTLYIYIQYMIIYIYAVYDYIYICTALRPCSWQRSMASLDAHSDPFGVADRVDGFA